jgi:DNA primase catalytic subunit
MEIVPALMILLLGGIFGVSVTVGYFAYDAAWKKDEEKKEWLKLRILVLDTDMSELKGWRKHYTWRVEQLEERLKRLEPTESAE